MNTTNDGKTPSINKRGFDNTIDRLKIALEIGSDADLAELLGFSPTAFSNRRKLGSIPYQQLITFLPNDMQIFSWVFKGDPITRTLHGTNHAATEVALIYSPVAASLLQDMDDTARTEGLNAAQLRARYQHRLPDHVAPAAELALLDHYRTANDDDKQMILRFSGLAADAAQALIAPPAMQAVDVNEEERQLIDHFRALSPQQRTAKLRNLMRMQATSPAHDKKR